MNLNFLAKRIFLLIVISTFSFAIKMAHSEDEHGHGHSHAHEEDAHETHIHDEMAENSGIRTEIAGKRAIAETLSVNGKVLPSEHRIAHIIPRFSGIVKEGRKHIGDPVEKGEVLAVVESNQSLQPFEVRSQIAGTVINGHLIVGEFVPENQWVYIVADLSEVWVDLMVPLSQRKNINLAQKVKIFTPGNDIAIDGEISYIAPYADDRSQSQIVRTVLKNDKKLLLPGMYVRGVIAISESNVEVAIQNSALQTLRGETTVFKKHGEHYEATPVKLGRTDGEWTEVVSGLSAGDEYVTQNAFLIKADILKSGAAHDH